jgi:hypothetical protein
MKHIILIAGFALALMSFTWAITGDEVVSALKKASPAEFSSYFDDAIDLTLPGKPEIKNIDKAQASATVKGFFEKNKVNGFQLISQREMGGTMYVAGKLTSAGASYNITVMMKDKDNKPSVVTVRIN